jgi:hypothetical protein
MSLKCSCLDQVRYLSSSDDNSLLTKSNDLSVLDESTVIVLLIEDSEDYTEESVKHEGQSQQKQIMMKGSVDESQLSTIHTCAGPVIPTCSDNESLIGLQFINSHDLDSENTSYLPRGHRDYESRNHPPQEIRLEISKSQRSDSLSKRSDASHSRNRDNIPNEVRILTQRSKESTRESEIWTRNPSEYSLKWKKDTSCHRRDNHLIPKEIQFILGSGQVQKVSTL